MHGIMGMDDGGTPSSNSLLREQSKDLLSVLKEMKEGLDLLRPKVDALTLKVKQKKYPTAEGVGYLEVKHLLLLEYCQLIVYYLLRKAKGLSVDGHPLVRSLVEIRLFLEKIRPIDKKLEYQIQKLMQSAEPKPMHEKAVKAGKEEEQPEKPEEDPLKFRPNPEMLPIPTVEDTGGVYRPPRFLPQSMEEEKMTKLEKQAKRKDKELLRQAKQSSYVQELMADMEDRPEEVREIVGAESRELTRYKAKREERERREEELFTRAPVTRLEKKIDKHMRKSRNGLLGLSDGFFDDVKMLPLEERDSTGNTNHAGKRHKKRKVRF